MQSSVNSQVGDGNMEENWVVRWGRCVCFLGFETGFWKCIVDLVGLERDLEAV